eukprot:9382866-Alexandrium_andersonii.AAC.1
MIRPGVATDSSTLSNITPLFGKGLRLTVELAVNENERAGDARRHTRAIESTGNRRKTKRTRKQRKHKHAH